MIGIGMTDLLRRIDEWSIPDGLGSLGTSND